MSVSDLEQYLLRDDIKAGERLLTQTKYREDIRRIARRVFNGSFPQYLEDAIQEAEIHTLEKARQHEFLAALFCKVLRKQGGKVKREPNSLHRIYKIPPAILERASQLVLGQGLEIACGSFCFCQEFNDTGQTVTLLTCDHPLRKAVIELALGEERIGTTTLLNEFYAWHYSVAKNKIRDCLRRYQGQALPSLDRLDRLENPLIDSIAAGDTNRILEEIDREQLRQQAIRCLREIDLLFPKQRYIELYEELYVQGKTKKQVAESWNLPQDRIRQRDTKLKEQILRCLGRLGVEMPEDNQRQRRRRSRKDYDL